MFWAVPCFVMVTGALLLDPSKQVGYGKVFRKYIPRMIIALTAFSLIFRIIDILLGKADSDTASWIDLGKALITGKGLWAHMWYLYTMIALYLIIPVIRPFVKQNPKKEINILLVILIVFLSVLPFVTGILDIGSGFYIPVQTIYPMYLIMGYYLYNKYFDSQSIIYLCLTGYMTGITVFTLIYINAGNETLKGLVNSYSFPITIIGAVGMFMLILNNKHENKLLTLIDDNSFGIYLMHMIPLKILFTKVLTKENINPVMIIVTAGAAFLSSLIITAVLRKIPIIRKIL